jgi:hypothetical membrane protein
MKNNIHPIKNLVLIAIYASSLALVLFLLLHIIMPEYDPSWRFVSEYANGQFGFIMRFTFLLFSLATLATALLVNRIAVSKLGKSASILFFISSLGLTLAAIFNQDPVTSTAVTTTGNLHGFAAMLGIPTFCIGAILAGLWLNKQKTHKTFVLISFLPLASFLSMGIYLSSSVLPGGFAEGQITGLLNRLFILAQIGWTIYFARKVLDLQHLKGGSR